METTRQNFERQGAAVLSVAKTLNEQLLKWMRGDLKSTDFAIGDVPAETLESLERADQAFEAIGKDYPRTTPAVTYESKITVNGVPLPSEE